jgi:hypothetical protein
LVHRQNALKFIKKELAEICSIGNLFYIGSSDDGLYTYLKEIPTGISCSVGGKEGEASFFLDLPREVLNVLKEIVGSRV